MVKESTCVIFGDMLELGDNPNEMHVGRAPTLVNSQTGLRFGFDQFMGELDLHRHIALQEVK